MRDTDLCDELIGPKNAAQDIEEVLDRDNPFPLGASNLKTGIQGRQGNGHIRRTHRKAGLTSHDGMVAVVTFHGMARTAAFPITQDPSAHPMGIPIIPAACILAQVSPHSGHVADFRSGDRLSRFGKKRILVPDYRRPGDLDQFCGRTYPQPFPVLLNAVQTRDGLDVY